MLMIVQLQARFERFELSMAALIRFGKNCLFRNPFFWCIASRRCSRPRRWSHPTFSRHKTTTQFLRNHEDIVVGQNLEPKKFSRRNPPRRVLYIRQHRTKIVAMGRYHRIFCAHTPCSIYEGWEVCGRCFVCVLSTR